MRVLCLIGVLLFAHNAWGAPSVHLAAKASVESPVIRLGDIAQLSGFSQEARSKLGRIALGRAPLVGANKVIPKAYIARRVADNFGRQVAVVGPDRMKVSRQSTLLSGTRLKMLVRSGIESRVPYDLSEIAHIRVPTLSDLRVPAGATARVQFSDGDAFEGPVTAELIIEDGTQRVSSRKLSILVDRYAAALGTRGEFRRGHRITRDDLVPIRIPRSALPRDAITRPEFVDGAELRRRVKPGEPLRQTWIKIPPVVTRGERVRIVARRGGIRLSTTGEALNNAAFGRFVRVRNLDSRKIVTGRAAAPGTVELEF